MGKINLLPEKVANKIAAGEVVERPASVVKELVENSIDANSSQIKVKVKNGGKDYIQVIDNGQGMAAEDTRLAFERHATSKIEQANDLFALRTLGFRGEALPSIAAVSKVEIVTKAEDSLSGTKLQLAGGEIKDKESCGCRQGTNIIVRDLFFNTPVRYKYLKKTSTEIGHISDIINRLSLSYPNISFSLEHNDRKILETTGNGNLLDVIFNIYGREVAQEMIEVDYEDHYMQLKGFIAKPTVTRSSRRHQSYFVNGRFIKSGLMSKAVEEAYHTLLTIDRYPIVVLKLKLNPIHVDVNIHPTKLEAKFSRGDLVYELVKEGVSQAIKGSELVPELKLSQLNKQKESDKKEVDEKETPKEEYKQNKLQLQKNKESNSKNKKRFNYRQNNYNKQDSKEERAKKIDKLFGVKQVGSEDNKLKEDLEIKEENLDYQSNFKLIPLGQIHQTYIVAQGKDGMYIIDQHAAHERIIYENLLAKFKEEEVQIQELLVPLQLELTYQEVKLLEDRKDRLEQLGFEVEEFGGNSYILRGVPVQLYNLDDKDLIFDSIDRLLEQEATENYQLVEEFITMLACKTAIKAGDKLSTEEMNQLLGEVDEYDVTNCPHGRPVVMHLSKKELEKEFKRR
ncbi:DNA mismatch repair endonuclease MutL [Halanaerocella petrolearia]